jgi:phosphoglycerol transferase MdoB-like AlkP superfamily enzyme
LLLQGARFGKQEKKGSSMSFFERLKGLRCKASPVWLIALLFLVLPNLPSMVSASVFGSGVPHGIINLEFILIGIVGLLLPRGVVFVLLFLELLVDYAYGICYTYKFTLQEFLISLRYVTALPMARIASGMLAFAFGIVLCAILAAVLRPREGKRMQAAVVLLLCAILPLAVDTVNGQNFMVHKDVTLASYRLIRAPLMTLATWQLQAVRQENKESHAADLKMASASAQIISLIDGRSKDKVAPNVVLILVESWGLALDPKLAGDLIAGYSEPAIANKYQVSTGTVPFSGLTIPAEARELCQSTMGFHILKISEVQTEKCLPRLLQDRGYQSSAIHGYLGQMFYREKWYPEMGFDSRWFKTDLKAAGLPECKGAFPGICDASIARWIDGSILSSDQGRPKFVYWVTLNSHLPVPSSPDLPADHVCQAQPALADSSALCSWYRLEKTALQSIQKMAADKTARPTIFVIVGDHAPPFGSPALKADFSAADVPYIILVPKD